MDSGLAERRACGRRGAVSTAIPTGEEHGVHHAEALNDGVVAGHPLGQLLDGDGAVLVRVDQLRERLWVKTFLERSTFRSSSD